MGLSYLRDPFESKADARPVRARRRAQSAGDDVEVYARRPIGRNHYCHYFLALCHDSSADDRCSRRAIGATRSVAAVALRFLSLHQH